MINPRLANVSHHFLPYTLAILIGLFAAQPFLVGHLAFGDDTLLHLARVQELATTLRAGVIYSRFSPDLVYGFGYPIFNYYAPLFYYLVAPLYLLGLSISTATLTVLTLICVLGATGMFAWVRRYLTDTFSLLASASYALAPYILFNLNTRGAFAEALALSLIPWAMWAIHRSLRDARCMVPGALLFAAVVLSHNITALLTLPLMVGVVICESVSQPRPGGLAIRTSRTILMRGLAMLLLGLGLSAFFWIPALFERDLVQLDRIYTPEWAHYANSFIRLRELLTWIQPVDQHIVLQRPALSISLLQIPLTLPALLGAIIGGQARSKSAVQLYLIAVAVAYCFMVIALSAPIWDIVPALRLLQYPWRFLGPASFALAGVAAFGAQSIGDWLTHRIAGRFGILATSTLAVLLLSASSIFVFSRLITPISFDNSMQLTTSGLALDESQSGRIGTTVEGEYLPVGLPVMPLYADSVFVAGNDRLRRDLLPETTIVQDAQFEALQYRLVVSSLQPVPLTFRTLYFQGWSASIDGVQVEPFASKSTGLLSVAVPVGVHEVSVWFGTTPVRSAADVISVLAIVASLGIIILCRHRSGASYKQSDTGMSKATGIAVGAILVSLFAVKTIVIDHVPSPFMRNRYDGDRVSGVDVPAHVNFGNQMYFLGIDSTDLTVASGDTIQLSAYWRSEQAMTREYSAAFQVVDGNGVIFASANEQHPGGIPTTNWTRNTFVRKLSALKILPGTPPGHYTLRVSAYEYGHPDQTLAMVQDDSIVGTWADVAEIVIIRPRKPALPSALSMQFDSNSIFSPRATLLGYNLTTRELPAGGILPATFFWQATEELPGDELFELRIGNVTMQPRALVPGLPTSQWRLGDVWRATHGIWVPPSLPDGEHAIGIRVPGTQNETSLGVINIVGRSHNFVKPQSRATFSAKLGSTALLTGAELPDELRAGERLEVGLNWQALGEAETSYKVFVHVLSSDGKLFASDDSTPAAWTRPTNSWLSGEFISDVHLINLPANLPPGSYIVECGMYAEHTNQRLASADGHTAITLGTIQIK